MTLHNTQPQTLNTQASNIPTNSRYPKAEWKSIFLSHHWLTRSSFLCLFYIVWIYSFRLIFLTILTYFVVSPSSRFQDISDIFSSNEVSLMGISALFFVGLTFALFPLSQNKITDHLNPNKIEKAFLPGAWRGGLVAFSVVVSLLILGVYKYLGYFIPFEETPLALLNISFRMVALAFLVYCEEYLFRYKIASYLKDLPFLWSAFWTALLFCLVKVIQFDLGWMHIATLFLLSISLSYRASKPHLGGGFARSAGYWAAILIIFHPLLSLPIFGNDFSGVLLVRYQPTSQSSSAQNLIFPSTSSTQNTASGQTTPSQTSSPPPSDPISALTHSPSRFVRLFSGGAAGPLASFIFQLFLILDIGRSILKRRLEMLK